MKRIFIAATALFLALIFGAIGSVSFGLPCAAGTDGIALAPDSIPLSYSVHGAGEPAIVFVHCWCCDKGYWKDQIPYFEKKHRVVALDLAGHGGSGLGRADWTIPAFAADVVSVVEALGLEKVILVGHSMGGPVSLEAARIMPKRVIGVIGVDTFQDFGQTIPAEQQKQYLAAFEADFPRFTAGFVRSMFPAGADSGLVERISVDMSSAPPEVGIGAMRNLLGYDEASAARDIKAPIRAVNADLWPTNVEGNRKYAPSFAVRYLPGHGHFVQIEDPAAFNKLLDETIVEIVKGK